MKSFLGEQVMDMPGIDPQAVAPQQDGDMTLASTYSGLQDPAVARAAVVAGSALPTENHAGALRAHLPSLPKIVDLHLPPRRLNDTCCSLYVDRFTTRSPVFLRKPNQERSQIGRCKARVAGHLALAGTSNAWRRV